MPARRDRDLSHKARTLADRLVQAERAICKQHDLDTVVATLRQAAIELDALRKIARPAVKLSKADFKHEPSCRAWTGIGIPCDCNYAELLLAIRRYGHIP